MPEIAVIFLLAGLIGIGLRNVAIALMILGLPPILTNTFVAVRQVDPTAVDAAKGMGMNGAQVIARVELPLAAPTIMSGSAPRRSTSSPPRRSPRSSASRRSATW